MSDIPNELLKLIGGVAAIGTVSAAFAYAMFRLFTTKWLENRFAERLETFKHQQNQEIEHLRFRINAMMDRTVKLHQHEFDVLPETWNLLTDAFFTIQPIALGYQHYPNLDEMSARQIDEFLETSPLTASQKDELKASPNRVKYYSEVKASHDLNRAINSYNAFHVIFSKNGIFIVDEIKCKFAAIDQMLKEAIIECQVQHTKFDKGVALHSEGAALLKALEQEVQRRLWNSQDAKLE